MANRAQCYRKDTGASEQPNAIDVGTKPLSSWLVKASGGEQLEEVCKSSVAQSGSRLPLSLISTSSMMLRHTSALISSFLVAVQSGVMLQHCLNLSKVRVFHKHNHLFIKAVISCMLTTVGAAISFETNAHSHRRTCCTKQ